MALEACTSANGSEFTWNLARPDQKCDKPITNNFKLKPPNCSVPTLCVCKAFHSARAALLAQDVVDSCRKWPPLGYVRSLACATKAYQRSATENRYSKNSLSGEAARVDLVGLLRIQTIKELLYWLKDQGWGKNMFPIWVTPHIAQDPWPERSG